MAIGPDGAIYAAWRHVYPGDLRDIAFTVSRDGGKSFSAPARVSEDKWQINGCPDDGPAIAVDAGGTVHVVWPTVLTAGAQPEGALFYASTRDGRQFTPRLRIPTLGSPRPQHPQIVVGPTGRIVIAWDETVSGQRVAAMRELKAGPQADVRRGGHARFGGAGDVPGAGCDQRGTGRGLDHGRGRLPGPEPHDSASLILGCAKASAPPDGEARLVAPAQFDDAQHVHLLVRPLHAAQANVVDDAVVGFVLFLDLVERVGAELEPVKPFGTPVTSMY